MPATMDNYAPFDSGIGAAMTESFWRKTVRHNRADGVLSTAATGSPADEMAVYAPGTGMELTVFPGEVMIHGHWGRSSSQKTLDVSAADPTNPRIDLVVCRADFTNDRVELDILQGQPAATPVAPSATVSFTKAEIPLAEVTVNAAATVIAQDKLRDRRPRFGFGLYTPFKPTLYYEGNTSGSWTQNPVGLGTGSTSIGGYQRYGKIVQIWYLFQWGSSPYNGGTGRIFTLLPDGLTAADEAGQNGNDHRILSRLDVPLVAPGNTGGLFQGTSLVIPGTKLVAPFFTRSGTDTRIRWYSIAAGTSGHPQTPFISGGWPEGGALRIEGLLEVR